MKSASSLEAVKRSTNYDNQRSGASLLKKKRDSESKTNATAAPRYNEREVRRRIHDIIKSKKRLTEVKREHQRMLPNRFFTQNQEIIGS